MSFVIFTDILPHQQTQESKFEKIWSGWDDLQRQHEQPNQHQEYI